VAAVLVLAEPAQTDRLTTTAFRVLYDVISAVAEFMVSNLILPSHRLPCVDGIYSAK
jgi:hypothetical protein